MHGSSCVTEKCSGSLIASYEDVLYVMVSMVVLVGPLREDVESSPDLDCRGGASIAPALDNDDLSSPILEHHSTGVGGRFHFSENDISDVESIAMSGYSGSNTHVPAVSYLQPSIVLHMDANDEEEEEVDESLEALVDMVDGKADVNSNGSTNTTFEKDGGNELYKQQSGGNGGRGVASEDSQSGDAPYTMTIVVVLTGLQVMIVDQVLGLHLPIFKFCVGSLTCFTENRLEEEDKELEDYLRKGMAVYNEGNNNINRMGGQEEQNEIDSVFEDIETRDNDVRRPSVFNSIDGKSDASLEGNNVLQNSMSNSKLSLSSKTALSVAVQADVRVEYFNNLLKCWETMVEQFTGWVISDACSYRGSGIMFHASCPLRVNISSALLNTLSDVSQRLDLFLPHLSSSYLQARISDLRRVRKDGKGCKMLVMNVVDEHGARATSSIKPSSTLLSPVQIVQSTTTQGGREISKSKSLIEESGRQVAAAPSSKQQHYKVGDGSMYNTLNNCNDGVTKKKIVASWVESPVRPSRLTTDRDSQSSGQTAGISPLSLFSQNYHVNGRAVRGGGFELDSTDPRDEEINSNVVITHQTCASLPPDTRLAFSLLNSTGQEVRYFQPLENDSTRCLQYLQTSSCGMLIFGATMTTIHNGKVEEVPFPEQSEVIVDGDNNVTQPTIGPQEEEKAESDGTSASHTFAMQVCGYRWLPCVYADHLGIRAFPLYPLIGRLSVHSLAPASHIQMATSLIASVYPLNGGRQVCLRSCFRLLNGTDHPVMIVEGTSPSMDPSTSMLGSMPTGYKMINPGQMHQFPVTLLQSSIEMSDGSSLGCFWVKPVKSVSLAFDSPRIGAAKKQKRRTHSLDMDFCSVPVQLLHAVIETQGLNGECIVHRQVSCPAIHVPMGKPHPPFSYCLELRRREVKFETAGLVNTDPDIKLVAVRPKPNEDEFHRLGNYSWKARDGEQQETHSTNAGASLSFSPHKGTKYAEGIKHKMSFYGSVESPRKKDTGEKKKTRRGGGVARKPRRSKAEEDIHNNHQVAYTYDIILYPPFVVENLLSHRAEFELIDQSHNLLWVSWLEPGESVGVHTIGMNETLLLLVNLEYARSSKGVVVHSGRLGEGWTVNSGTKAGDGDVEDYMSNSNKTTDAVTNIVLTDTVGQKLQLSIENSIGGRGHRHVSIYCPFWLINTSNHVLRFKQDGVRGFPAGTVSKLGDGSRLIFSDDETYLSVKNDAATQAKHPPYRIDSFSSGFYEGVDSPPQQHYKTTSNHVFTGMPGPLRPMVPVSIRENNDPISPVFSGHGITASTPVALLKEELSLEELKQFACMFSFMDGGDHDYRSMPNWGEKKLRVQVEDSMMSKAFSVDSIGMSQVLSVKNSQHNLYELGFNVTIPPGRLGQFTKVVQFWPRYVVVNEFEDCPIKLVQYSSLRVAQKDVCSVKPCEQLPFDLPEVWGDRNECRLSVGHGWGLSSSFPLDVAGEYTLRFRPYLEWHATSHIDTRGDPEYEEIIPAGLLELGIWFETDWYRRQLIVKNTKRGKYAYKHTDIQRGDILLCVNGKSTAGMSFSKAMSLIRDSLQDAADAVNAAADAFLEEEAVGTQGDDEKVDSSPPVNKDSKTPRTVAPQFRNRIPTTKEVHPGTLFHFGTMEERYRQVRSKAIKHKDRREFDDNNNNPDSENLPEIGVVPGVCNVHSGFSNNVLRRELPDVKNFKNYIHHQSHQIFDTDQSASLVGPSEMGRCWTDKFLEENVLSEVGGHDTNDSTTVVEKDQEDLYVRVELR